MAHPGQPIPPGPQPNAGQGRDESTMRRESDEYAGARDLMLDADEIQSLTHGGFGGEQEYTDSSAVTSEARGRSSRVAREYVNQTDMTDQTGDRSLSEPSPEPRGKGHRGT